MLAMFGLGPCCIFAPSFFFPHMQAQPDSTPTVAQATPIQSRQRTTDFPVCITFVNLRLEFEGLSSFVHRMIRESGERQADWGIVPQRGSAITRGGRMFYGA